MQISISARGIELPESVRERAESRISRLTRYDDRLTKAEVVFSSDHGVSRAEIRMTGPHAIVAHGAGGTHRSALDQAVDRLSRQLRRRIERSRNPVRETLRATVTNPESD